MVMISYACCEIDAAMDDLLGWGWDSVRELPTADDVTRNPHLTVCLIMSFFVRNKNQ